MKKYLLPENGRFYKANLHCHTTVSDGRKTPEDTKAAYRAMGYDFIALTDAGSEQYHVQSIISII